MISSTLRIVLTISVLVYFIIILMYLKNKTLVLRYSLLWLVAGIVLGIMVIWPQTLVKFVHMIGITSNMNGLFIICIAFVIMILMSLTAIVSKQSEKIKNLSQTTAKLEKRIREIEEKI